MANSANAIYDVDLLRPGTVPMSPDTVLWFEFLLDPSLLDKHLKKSMPDPSPTDLIVKFLAVAPDIQPPPAPSTPKIIVLGSELPGPFPKLDEIVIDDEQPVVLRSRKNLALKILSLKVTAYLKWDLNILQTNIPLPMQATLLKDLLYLAMDEEPDIDKHMTLDLNSLSHAALFAITLYHRWVIRSVINSSLPTKQNRLPYIPIPGLADTSYAPAGVYEELTRCLEAQVSTSVEVLSHIDPKTTLAIPSFESFVTLTEDSTSVQQDWTQCTAVSASEFHCQLNFDIGSYYFYRDDYEMAGQHFQKAQKLFATLPEDGERPYCSASQEEIEGYCAACDVCCVKNDTLSQMHRAINNQYTGILAVLRRDNVCDVIAPEHRDALEMDVRGAATSGRFTVARDLVSNIRALNIVKRVVTGAHDLGSAIDNLAAPGALEGVFSALKALPASDCPVRRSRIERFLVDIALTRVVPNFATKLVRHPKLTAMLSPQALKEITEEDDGEDVEIPDILTMSDWPMDSGIIANNDRLKIGNLESRLIASYDPDEVRDLISQLNTISKKPMWKVNNRWDLPIPVHSVVMSLPKGFLQDLCYILLAKAKELCSNKDFAGAQRLMSVVEAAVSAPANASTWKGALAKLGTLVRWEALLAEIQRFLAAPPEGRGDTTQLAADCTQCLAAAHATTDTVIPRTEVVEHCAVCLLNLGHWEHLVSLEARWKYFPLAAATAAACLEVSRAPAKKKLSKDLWDLVLPTYGPSVQPKRSGGVTTSVIHRDSPTGSPAATRAALNAFLGKLAEPVALSVAVSLLARLHNALRDEPSLEIAAEHVALWPAVVSNANSYHIRAVTESLAQVLGQALHLYPNDVSWLKLTGDLNFVTNHHSTALRFYLEAGVVSSNFFSQPVPPSALDNAAYKRMIKCCTALSCHTQAAVLCQFLDEVDYMTAFKSLSDARPGDAMDGYYACVWDATILEHLVQMHARRGELDRKHQVIKIIGLLELNPNNNEEIQREAINIRKARFMRSMARQYIVN